MAVSVGLSPAPTVYLTYYVVRTSTVQYEYIVVDMERWKKKRGANANKNVSGRVTI